MEPSGIYKEIHFGEQMMAIFGGKLELKVVEPKDKDGIIVSISQMEHKPVAPGQEVEPSALNSQTPAVFLKFGSVDSIEALEKMLAKAKEDLAKKEEQKKEAAAKESEKIEEFLAKAKESNLLQEVLNSTYDMARNTDLSLLQCLICAMREWDI